MDVSVRVDLSVPAGQKHVKAMRSAAASLTDRPRSVRVRIVSGEPQTMIADFTMTKARQIDVVDRITRACTFFMPDYSKSTIWFPQ
jgi:hypothetical protein